MSLTEAEQAIFDHLVAEPGPVTWVGPRSPESSAFYGQLHIRRSNCYKLLSACPAQ